MISLKEQLAAKKATDAEKIEPSGALPSPDIDVAIKAAEKALQTAKPKASDYTPEFRKGSFAYTFKYSKGSIKCDKSGVYTPKTAEEFEILKHQVLAGNILFN